MTEKTYLLVFTQSGDFSSTLKHFSSLIRMDEESFYVFAENVIFLKTAASINDITMRLQASSLGSMHFVLSDVSTASIAGRALPVFWNFLHEQEASTAA